MSKNKKIEYEVKEFPSDAIAKEIKELVESAKKDRANLLKEKNNMYNKTIEFVKIKIHKDKLLYYVENNRTGENCKEYIKKKKKDGHDLGDDYFSLKNIALQNVQQAYHEIIFNEADSEKISKIYQIQGEQKEPIFITSKGITVNGNSRLSTIRECLDWIEVECYVYPEALSENYLLIEAHTSERDNRVDFGRPDPWYSKLATYLKYEKQKQSDPMKAKLMGYTSKKTPEANVADMHKDITICRLAKKFLDSNEIDDFEYFEDLSALGGDYGLQAFKTMASRESSLSNILDKKQTAGTKRVVNYRVISEVQKLAFQNISNHKNIVDKEKGIVSLHKAIEKMYSINNIVKTGEKIIDTETEEENFKPDYKPFDDQSPNERIESSQKFLEQAIYNEKVKNEADEKRYPLDCLALMKKHGKNGAAKLNDLSELSTALKEIEAIEAILQKYRDEINRRNG